MTPAQTAIARRLVARPEWRWMPGMLACVRWPEGDLCDVGRIHEDGTLPEGALGAFPDLTNPATAGCLLEMLAGVFTVVEPSVIIDPTAIPRLRWTVRLLSRRIVQQDHDGATLGEAAALALLALWGEPRAAEGGAEEDG